MAEPVVRMEKISKSFGPVRALRNVDLVLNHSEVLGIVGDNGAGKSTLMKVLTGVHQPDSGQIYFQGRPVRFNSPHDSRAMGIEMVYQDLALAGNLTVADNIYLGRELTKKRLGGLVKLLDHRGMAEGATHVLERLKIEIHSPHFLVETLSGGQRQAIAVARSVGFDARVVIMDEPTAALAVREVSKVLDVIRRLKEHDVAVILISHRMPDIFEVCDRIVVLRQGVKVGDVPRSQTNMDEVVALITGSQKEALHFCQEVA
ncbi:MAG TPA: sugar ABC transporter ATP-binding protein [Anaerolineae bacterium]|nr:sugar ABC transporter ATP-binding protein [Anaerolineae bacterium]